MDAGCIEQNSVVRILQIYLLLCMFSNIYLLDVYRFSCNFSLWTRVNYFKKLILPF